MDLAWVRQPAKQLHGRCSHWQSTTWPQPERKGQNLCKHASFTHPQHAIVHAIRECHSCPALLPLQLVHSLCSNIFHAHKQFRVLGVLSSLMLKSKVVQRLLPVLVIPAGQSWQQNPGRAQAKAACSEGCRHCLHHSRLLWQEVHL